MKKKVSVDKNKSISLLDMAKITLERLNSFNKLKYPSNTLNDYYDVLHKLMESYTSLIGVKFIGDNAHKELIDFISKVFFEDEDKIFLQNLRQFRNQIYYEGFNVSQDYLKRNVNDIEEIIHILINKLQEMLR
ncbi:MAG: hypothetical protein WC260_03585 [Candidatus Pacearchaeota archaeon]